MTAAGRGRPPAGRLRLRCAGVVVAALLAGCAARPELSVDTLDQPWSCARVAWMDKTDRPASLAEQRIRAEVLQALATRGYTVGAEAPDCLVSGLVFTGTRPGSPVSVGIGAGSWGGNVGGSVGISLPVGGRARQVGNLALDFIDLEQNAEVWRGTLLAAFPTPEPGTEQVAAAVQQVLEALPPPASR